MVNARLKQHLDQTPHTCHRVLPQPPHMQVPYTCTHVKYIHAHTSNTYFHSHPHCCCCCRVEGALAAGRVPPKGRCAHRKHTRMSCLMLLPEACRSDCIMPVQWLHAQLPTSRHEPKNTYPLTHGPCTPHTAEHGAGQKRPSSTNLLPTNHRTHRWHPAAPADAWLHWPPCNHGKNARVHTPKMLKQQLRGCARETHAAQVRPLQPLQPLQPLLRLHAADKAVAVLRPHASTAHQYWSIPCMLMSLKLF